MSIYVFNRQFGTILWRREGTACVCRQWRMQRVRGKGSNDRNLEKISEDLRTAWDVKWRKEEGCDVARTPSIWP